MDRPDVGADSTGPVAHSWRERFQVFGEPEPRPRTGDSEGQATSRESGRTGQRRAAPAQTDHSTEHVEAAAEAGAGAASQIDKDGLEKAFTWTAGGFTALIALLTFFGIKEGTLDQALRVYAPATLCVFIFLGIGVVAALFVWAVQFQSRVRLWALIAVLLVMLFTASVFFPDMRDTQTELARAAFELEKSLWDVARPLLAALVVVGLLVGSVLLLTRSSERALPTWQIAVIAAIALGVVVWLLLPRKFDASTGQATGIDEQRTVTTALTIALLLAALWLLAWSLVHMTTLPTMAGLVVVAVTATSLGLYGATKLAVQSKSLSVLPQVVAKTKGADGNTSVEMSVTVGRFRGRNLVVELTGVPRAEAARTLGDSSPRTPMAAVTLWAALLRPDALDEIDQTIDVPLAPTRWESLSVRYCTIKDTEAMAPRCGADARLASVVSVRNRAPEAGLQQVTAKIAPAEADTLRATFAASDVTPGVLTKVELCRTRGGTHTTHVLDVTLAPDAEGNLTWEAVVPAGKSGDVLVLRQASCVPGSRCQEMETLATYVRE